MKVSRTWLKPECRSFRITCEIKVYLCQISHTGKGAGWEGVGTWDLRWEPLDRHKFQNHERLNISSHQKQAFPTSKKTSIPMHKNVSMASSEEATLKRKCLFFQDPPLPSILIAFRAIQRVQMLTWSREITARSTTEGNNVYTEGA